MLRIWVAGLRRIWLRRKSSRTGSIPIAIIATIWSAPTEDNIVKDLTTQYKRLGPSEGARILSETNIEEKENNEDELIR